MPRNKFKLQGDQQVVPAAEISEKPQTLSKNGSKFQMIVLHSSENVKLFCAADKNPDLQQNGFWQLQMFLSPSDIAQAVKIQKPTLSWKLAFLATHSCRIKSTHEKQNWNARI